MQQYRKNLGKVSLTAEGAWKLNKEFEVLSIVYDEHTQHGFISKKDVPVGVDLYNAEYWMPLNVSGYIDSNIIILNDKTSEANIKSYTLKEAINSVAAVGRKPGAMIAFYNENTDRLDIGGRWEIWQYNAVDNSNWENVECWQSLYYNYNKFVGWYRSEELLKANNPFPEIGCYAFVGTQLNEATIYRCDRKYVWEDTAQHAWDYVKVIVDGNVTVGENGNWFNNGVDTNIPASIKGENGKTAFIRNNNNKLERSYDNVNWEPISDEIAAYFRWRATKADTQANNVGRIQISRDKAIWTDLSGDIINNLHISRYIGADESLPTSGIAEGTIYAKGPTYADEDTSHSNPIYRLWVYAWKGNTLAWQDNGEFQSIAAGIVQETGNSETQVMSQAAVTRELSELGSYVENNPEYVRTYTDAEGRFLWGIKHDGSIEFAKGVPTPIKEYIVKFVFNRVMPLEEAHEQYLKESESPEWARVIVDAEGKVLWGIRQDGSVEFTKGVPSSIKNYIDSLDKNNDEEVERINQLVIGLLADVKPLKDTYQYISNPEWACAIVDAEERVLMGIKVDGSYYIPNRDMYHVESNPEWLKAVVDADNKILFGIKHDGSCYIPKGISEDAKKGLLELTARISWFETGNNPEWLQVTTDSEGRVLEGIGNDGKKYFPKQEMLEKYNDPEGRTEMTLDAVGKVVSYRNSKGVKHENKQHTGEASFDNLVLTERNSHEIANALENIGFKTEDSGDSSNDSFVELPIPRVCATVKIHVPKFPNYKTDDIEGYLEYLDKDGNHFMKPIILNAQGSSSMNYYVKNLSIDFVDGSKIKFGNWVSQDSFHIKKYYIDAFRGQCVVGYHLMEQVYQTRPLGEKKPYDYMNANSSVYDGIGKFKKDYNTGALCHPDGFPIVVYHVLNGEEVYMGVYAWCLKKHRDNYYADKSKATNIILDGTLNLSTIWGSNVNWSQFEIRNPKDLIDINGNEYDGENPKELSNTDSLSSEVKDYIERVSQAYSVIDSNKTKEVFEQYFLVDAFIDWYLVSQITYNQDGFSKNWIWCTWDGEHWTPTLYDVDSIFGSFANGTYVIPNSTRGLLQGSIDNHLKDIYADDISVRYKELRDKKVFDVDNITKLLTDWIDRIGYNNLKNDLELYNETPSYRNNHLNDEWEVSSYQWSDVENTYSDNIAYLKGDTCIYEQYVFKAKVDTIGVPPLSQVYNKAPYAMGYFNSPLRVKNWLNERISYLDSVYNYNV